MELNKKEMKQIIKWLDAYADTFNDRIEFAEYYNDDERAQELEEEQQEIIAFYNKLKEDAYVEVCPNCGALCNDDQTIEDHGCCIDCFHERLNK